MSKELEAKKKALALTMEKIEKTYGKGTIMKLGDAPIIDVEPTTEIGFLWIPAPSICSYKFSNRQYSVREFIPG